VPCITHLLTSTYIQISVKCDTVDGLTFETGLIIWTLKWEKTRCIVHERVQ